MSEHTPGAVNAAAAMWQRVNIIHKMNKFEFTYTFATVIDQYTVLPEITAERDRLREATRICLSWIKAVAGVHPNRKTREIIKTAQAALAKSEAESGEKLQKGKD